MRKLIDKIELMKIIKELNNPMDKFLILGIFNGLIGDSLGFEQLLKIRKDEIIGNKIILPTGEYVMDETLEKIAHDSVKQNVYIKMGVVGNSSEDYEFNPKCEYVFRCKPLPVNNFGLDAMTEAGLRGRLRNINKYLGTSFNASVIKQSGARNALMKAEKELTIREAEVYLKNKGFNLRRSIIMELLKSF